MKPDCDKYEPEDAGEHDQRVVISPKQNKILSLSRAIPPRHDVPVCPRNYFAGPPHFLLDTKASTGYYLYMKNTATYFNAAREITINFSGEEFVIIGDEKKVSDRELLAMYDGRSPKGWEVTR
jgi:hypothetical protein